MTDEGRRMKFVGLLSRCDHVRFILVVVGSARLLPSAATDGFVIRHFAMSPRVFSQSSRRPGKSPGACVSFGRIPKPWPPVE
jgi:hypothetical protein